MDRTNGAVYIEICSDVFSVHRVFSARANCHSVDERGRNWMLMLKVCLLIDGFGSMN